MAETTVLRSSAINRPVGGGGTSGKPHAQLSGALPVVQVNMNAGGPQIQGGQATAKQGVTILPPKGGRRNFTTGGLPNQPAKQSVVILPPKELRSPASALTADQLLLCRHLADKYLSELRAGLGDAPAEEVTTNNIKLAEETIVAIDAAMTAITTAAAVVTAAAPAPRAVAVRPQNVQAASTTTPRRVARPVPPPVTVTMDAGHPVVQTDLGDLPNQDSNQTGPIEDIA
jgi:hypothetical protein